MKKTVIFALAAVLLAGCSKSYNNYSADVVGTGDSYSSLPAKKYIEAISQDMATDVLNELETAFKVAEMENPVSVRFDISGGSINTEGVSWKIVGQDRALCGMTLKKISEDTWEMAYAGPYKLLSDTYEVNFIMKAKIGTLVQKGHYNWAVTLNGTRTEREGYTCTYSTSNTVLYQCINNNTVGWNNLEGSFLLTVYKSAKPVDMWILEYNGKPSEAKFSRGL